LHHLRALNGNSNVDTDIDKDIDAKSDGHDWCWYSHAYRATRHQDADGVADREPHPDGDGRTLYATRGNAVPVPGLRRSDLRADGRFHRGCRHAIAQDGDTTGSGRGRSGITDASRLRAQ
jgi:hypothetical protein